MVESSLEKFLLLHQLAPGTCGKAALNKSDPIERANLVLANADKLNCRKFVTARDIVTGNPKLNLAFVAHIFNTHPGLEPLSEADLGALEESLFASEGTREARAFCLWMNSLGIDPFVNNLFEDLRDGLVLLRVIDKVSPGIVDWNKVNQVVPLNKFKKLENCNYAVALGKQLKFSLVGIGGPDIVDGNKTLTLALVWQLMRFHIVSILKSLSKDGHDVTDEDMVRWANETVRAAGKHSTMANFRDPHLRDARFFIDLLDSVKPRVVNYELVSDGINDEAVTQNAKYAISVARKIGATIFLLPEDIVQVKPKMILTFVGTIMALDFSSSR
jgi:plastin-1